MKQLTHPQNAPRPLQGRPVPANPGKAWAGFKGTAEVRQALLPVQKHICAYCEIELEECPPGIGFHIEHILSKTNNPSLTFEWTNLMLSCFQTGNEIPKGQFDSEPISCGHSPLKRSNNYDPVLFIKPTEPDCQRYFFYELDGRVVPHDDLNAF